MDSPLLYGLTLAAGLLLCGVWYGFRLKKDGKSVRYAVAGQILGTVFGYLGAKGVYALFFWPSLYSAYGPGLLFRLAPEEFSFVGGCLGFTAGIAVAARTGGLNVSHALDLFAAPGCLLAAMARFGEVFLEDLGLGELSTIGLPEIEEGSLLAFFPVAIQDNWGMWTFSVSTFTALLALVICGTAGWADTVPQDKPGRVFELAGFLLCAVQLFVELTRMVSIIFYFVHVEQALCAVLMLILTVRICRTARGKFRKAPVFIAAVCIVFNGITQYLLDKPWKFESLIPENAFQWINENLAPFCYSILLLTTAAWTAAYVRAWKKR